MRLWYFVCFDSVRLCQQLSVMSRWVFLGWASTKLQLKDFQMPFHKKVEKEKG